MRATSDILKPPPPKILMAASKLDDAVGSIIGATQRRRNEYGRWESEVEATVLLGLMIRHTESLIALARTDLVLLPSAFAITRTVFEIGVRMRWLLVPNHEYDREARWLVHVEEEERLWKHLADLAEKTGDSVASYREREASIRSFRLAVAAKLPTATARPRRIPSVEDALKEQVEERRYIAYRLLSQFVHGGHFAGGTFRRGLGTAKEFGEKVSLDDWGMILQVAWWSLFHSAKRFIELVCEPGIVLMNEVELRSLTDSLDSLKTPKDGS